MRIRASILLLCLALSSEAKESPEAVLNEARADLDAGRYGKAIENAQACAAEFRVLRDTKNLAAALRVSGLGRLYSGAYGPAIESLTESLALSRQLHDFGSEIARLNDLGMAAYFEGRYREALDRYEEAQTRVREVPNDPWSPWARQVTTANIAILYQGLGQYDRALGLYTGLLNTKDALAPAEQAQLLSNMGALRRRLGDPLKALETYREAQSLYRQSRHLDGEITVLNNIGVVQSMDLGDNRGAEVSFTSAQRLAEKSGDRPLAVHAQLNRAEARYRAKQFGASRTDFEQASKQARKLDLKDEEWKGLYGLARDPATGAAEAHAELLAAVGLIESLRVTAGSTPLRSTFLADKRAVYDRLIETAATVDEAFRWMEQSRARTLQDQAHPQAKSLAEFRRELPADTAVLEYWIGNGAAAVLWIARESVGIRRWKPELGDLEEVRRVLADPKRADWREVLQPVAAQLLAEVPVLTGTGIRRLRIIPDGPLALLPFEALPLDAKDLLIGKFAVTYAPSAALSNSFEGATPRFRWPWQASLAGLADPLAGRGRGDGRVWSRLPYSRTETQEIAGIVGGRSELRMGVEARKTALMRAAGYPLVHLATHAQADLQDPDRSFILLAPVTPETQQYDYLFSQEVRTLRFTGSDLVTLSACETNVGVFVPGEGLRGFSEAFLAAGARSVLNSLWVVGDISTEQLMTRFYGRLAQGESAADALRQAKLDFIAHAESRHPAHWAGFVLNGDGDWRLPRLIGWRWFAMLALVVGGLLGLFLKLRRRF